MKLPSFAGFWLVVLAVTLGAGAWSLAAADPLPPQSSSPVKDSGPSPEAAPTVGVDGGPAVTGEPAAVSDNGADGGTSAAEPALPKRYVPRGDEIKPGRIVLERQYGIPTHWNGELVPITDEEAQEYAQVVDEFGAGAAEFRAEISALVQARYRERRSRLQDQYEERIKELEKEESRRRVSAIARFERFVQKYPRDPTFSPDAIFRLAELYFEQATEEYQIGLRKYDEDLVAFEAGELKVEPVSPVHHYEKTIALYQRMITEFPDHRLIDGAYYLLGFCLDEQGENDQAVVQFLELTRRFPNSRFYSEAWMRVGEYYFDNDKLPECIAAYSHVLETPDSPYYDKALYKLGWAHYRLNQYPEAIARFMEVLDYGQQRKESGVAEGSDLEPESLQYIAVSLSDDYWDRGIGYDAASDESGEIMEGFAEEYFKKFPSRPYEREVFVRLGEILFDASKYPGAVRAYAYALKLGPLSPDAPTYQDKIVQCWERARDFDKSSAAREALVEKFSEGTEWYNANKDNVEAVRVAQTLARTSLYSSAIFHHTQAQKYQAADKYDLAKVENEQAAKGYAEYLKRFPHDKNAYELNYYLADTLYNSLQFRAAATEYTKVRDSNSGSKYRVDSAINVYYSLQKLIEEMEKSGQLDKKTLLSGKERPDKLQDPEEIPAIKQELIVACDRFVEVAPTDERIPAVKLVAAETLYVYNHYDEARPRLADILDKYSNNAEVAKAAANYVLDYLLTKKDWAEVEKFAQYVQQRNVGDQTEYRTLELGALFQKAKQYMDEGEAALSEGKTADGNKRLEEAAGEYVRLVSQNKEHEFADKALFNAALAYVKSKRFDSALKLYERVYQEYPNSNLAPTALWEVADNAYKSYAFDKAISSFFLLVKKYKDSPKRPDAQFNAALTLENLQRYEEAAREYENYAKMFADREDAPAVFYKAALVQEKRGDDAQLIGTLNRFLAKYRKDEKQTDAVVDAYAKIADVYLKQGKQKDAEKYFKLTIDEFHRRKASTQSTAGFHAAHAKFQLAEFELKKYQAMTISGTGKEQLKAFERKLKELKNMEKVYQEVLPYKSLEWSLATAYRLGYLYENAADTILKSPCPKDVQRVGGQEACDEYQVLLQDRFATPLEEKAVAAYKVAHEQSVQSKYQNEWTRKSLEGLNRYLRAEYPIDKEPRRRFVGDQQVGLDVQAVASSGPKSLKGK